MSHVLEIGIGFPSLGLPWWLSWLRIRLQCQRPGFDPWVGKIPWRKEQLPTPVFWPGKFHGLYSPWGLRESARLSDFYSFSFPQLSTDYRQLLLCQELRVVAGGQDSHKSCSVVSDPLRPHGLYSQGLRATFASHLFHRRQSLSFFPTMTLAPLKHPGQWSCTKPWDLNVSVLFPCCFFWVQVGRPCRWC